MRAAYRRFEITERRGRIAAAAALHRFAYADEDAVAMKARVEPALDGQRGAPRQRVIGFEAHGHQHLRRNLERLRADQRFAALRFRFWNLIGFARARITTITLISFLLPLRRFFGSAGGGLGEDWGSATGNADVGLMFSREREAIGRVFGALIAAEIPHQAVGLTLDLDHLDAIEAAPFGQQRCEVNIVGRENPRLQHDRFPLEHAVVVAFGPK